MIKRLFTLSWIESIFLALVISAPPMDAQVDIETVSLDTARMNAYLAAEAEKLEREAWERINSREKLEAERKALRKEFLFMIGLDPLLVRTPLQPTVVRTIERKEYTIEVLYFQSMPRFYVTANLYKPKKGGERFPAVVWGPGHSSYRYGAKALRQNYAIPWVRDGYICMVIDPIQVAEVLGVHRGVSARGLRHWYARGYTPIGIEVWNAMRAIDYLIQRPNVEASKLTINGVSGGGHLSWMAGAADERITVVQPVAGTADVENHVKLDLQRMHCDCAYFINTFRHDWPTLAALIAPRPLLMHNSTEDAYYPPSGYGAVLQKAKQVFAFFGVPEKTDMFEVPGRHGYTQPQFNSYGMFQVAVELRNAQSGENFTFNTDIDITNWLPGTHQASASLQLSPDMPSGEYEILLALLDPYSLKPRIKLAIEGQGEDGWYRVSRVKID